jgi:hypothetical protein
MTSFRAFGLVLFLSKLFAIFTVFVVARRRIVGDVHDGRPEEVLRRNEEDGQQETRQSNPKTKGKIP